MREKLMPAPIQAISAPQRQRRNQGRLTGQKRPLKPRDVWTIRVRLQLEGRKRDLAMFTRASIASYEDAILCARK